MAIEITRPHHLGPREVRERVEALAARLAETYQLRYGWAGDRLLFERKGVNGFIDVDAREVTVYVEKGRFLPIPESVLRQQIEKQMDAYLR